MYSVYKAPIKKFFSPTSQWQDTFITVLSLVCLIAQMLITGLFASRLPAEIPVHFNWQLRPDRYGDNSNLATLVYVAAGIFVLLSVLMQAGFIMKNFKDLDNFGKVDGNLGITTLRTFILLRFAVALIFLGLTVLTIVTA